MIKGKIIKVCADCDAKVFAHEDRSLCRGCEEKKKLKDLFSEWDGNLSDLPENLLSIIHQVDDMRKRAEQVKKKLRELLDSGVVVPVIIQDVCDLHHGNLLKGAEEKMVNFYKYELKKFLCQKKNRETMNLIKSSSLVQRFPEVLVEIKRFLSDCFDLNLLFITVNTGEEFKVTAMDISYGREQVGTLAIEIGVISIAEKGKDPAITAGLGNYINLRIDGEGAESFSELLSIKKLEEVLLRLNLKSYKELVGRKVYYQVCGMACKLLDIA